MHASAACSLEKGEEDYTSIFGEQQQQQQQQRDVGGLDRDLWSVARPFCGCGPDYVSVYDVPVLCGLCAEQEDNELMVVEWHLEVGVWPERDQDDDKNEDLPAPLVVVADGWPLDPTSFPTPSSTRLSTRVSSSLSFSSPAVRPSPSITSAAVPWHGSVEASSHHTDEAGGAETRAAPAAPPWQGQRGLGH